MGFSIARRNLILKEGHIAAVHLPFFFRKTSYEWRLPGKRAINFGKNACFGHGLLLVGVKCFF